MENQSVGSPLHGQVRSLVCTAARWEDYRKLSTTGPAEASGWLVGEWVIGTVHGLKICATSHQIPVLKS